MSYKETKETLTNLYNDLREERRLAKEAAQQNNYKGASDKLALAIGKAQRQLLLAQEEIKIPFSGLEEERVLYQEVVQLQDSVLRCVEHLKQDKMIYDTQYSKSREWIEENAAISRNQWIHQKQSLEQNYDYYYKLLLKLKAQNKPLVGVEDKLHHFLEGVNDAHQKDSISIEELTEAMQVTYKRLTGGDKKTFDDYAAKLQAKDSIPLKALGVSLLLLGAALVASAIFFAPAVITASAGLGTIYGATAAVTLGSSLLTGAGSYALFAAKTDRMGIAKTMQDFDKGNLDNYFYDRVQPQY